MDESMTASESTLADRLRDLPRVDEWDRVVASAYTALSDAENSLRDAHARVLDAGHDMGRLGPAERRVGQAAAERAAALENLRFAQNARVSHRAERAAVESADLAQSNLRVAKSAAFAAWAVVFATVGQVALAVALR